MATIVADNNVNETDGTVYNFPRSTGNQDTLAAALQAVIDRKAGAPTRAVTRIELVLPPPIATHLATDTGDANTVARCFREDALVVDEHRGAPWIWRDRRWKADAFATCHYTSDAISLQTSGRDTVVSARVTGAFPGSPAMLRYRFTLETDAIKRLETTT